eukprot:m.246222 g.246222  ORF g.246222 m.246222 type:complete len:56 (+) comp68268_c0_seq1:160-327(+)
MLFLCLFVRARVYVPMCVCVCNVKLIRSVTILIPSSIVYFTIFSMSIFEDYVDFN